MRQILLLILLFFVGQWLVKALRRAQPQSRPGPQPGPQSGPQPGQQSGASARSGQGASRAPNGAAGRVAQGALPEPMVRCAECGVHAPQSDSVAMGSQSFCSHEHARAYAARHAGQNRAAR
jgi:uncharacterized protein